jgi:hypothetical protein
MKSARVLVGLAVLIAMACCVAQAQEDSKAQEKPKTPREERLAELEQALASNPEAVAQSLVAYYQAVLQEEGLSKFEGNHWLFMREERRAQLGAIQSGPAHEQLEALMHDRDDPAMLAAALAWQEALPPTAKDVQWLVNTLVSTPASRHRAVKAARALQGSALDRNQCEHVLHLAEEMAAAGDSSSESYNWMWPTALLQEQNLTKAQGARVKGIYYRSLEAVLAEDAPREPFSHSLSPVSRAPALTRQLLDLSPTAEEMDAIESLWLAAQVEFKFNSWVSDIPVSMANLAYALSEHAPDSPLIPMLKAILKRTEEKYFAEHPNATRGPLNASLDDLSPLEFAAHLTMAGYHVDYSTHIWHGAADFVGFDRSPLYKEGLFTKHRGEVFQYFLPYYERTGDRRAALMLGFCRDRRALDALTYWLLHAKAYGSENEWRHAGGLRAFICPSHIFLVMAIENIADKPLVEAITLDPSEIEMLRKRVGGPIELGDRSPYGTMDVKLAVSLLHAFAPEQALEDITTQFRTQGPEYRFVWQFALPAILTQAFSAGSSAEKLLPLLGDPDSRTDVGDEALLKDVSDWEKEKVRTALEASGCETILQWSYDSKLCTSGYPSKPDPLTVLVANDTVVGIGNGVRRIVAPSEYEHPLSARSNCKIKRW